MNDLDLISKVTGGHHWNSGVNTISAYQIVDVRVAYIRKLAILGNREPLVTANYSPVFCSYLLGPLDLNP